MLALVSYSKLNAATGKAIIPFMVPVLDPHTIFDIRCMRSYCPCIIPDALGAVKGKENRPSLIAAPSKEGSGCQLRHS